MLFYTMKLEPLFILIILLVFYGVSVYLKKRIVPKIKGTFGEYKVSSKLKCLKKKEYIVINDLLLKTGNSTTQIDHVVISKSGIFVIETKNYKGWIFDHEKSEYWTQTIYKYKKKFRNPIKQNWAHVYVLKKILSEYNYVRYFPIVVFAGSGKLKKITSYLPVIYTNKLMKTIENQNQHENLSYNQMKMIADKLQQHNIIDRKENRNHARHVKEHINRLKKN